MYVLIVFCRLLVYNGIYNTGDWGIIYMQIPIKELKQELKNNINECKNILSYDNVIVSKSIFGLFSKLINKFEKSKSYQAGLFVKSMDNWIDRHDKENQPLDNKITSFNIGDIFMVDWNISYSPELSYEHPCVVIGLLDNFLFVLPVSGQKQYLEIGYHPIDKIEGDRNYRIVDISDGFNKRCVIHLNQAKVISRTRILYKMGALKTDKNNNCSLLEEIKTEMLNKYFPNEYNRLLEENSDYRKRNKYLSIQRKCNQSRADRYRNENEELKKKVCELQSIIDKNDP